MALLARILRDRGIVTERQLQEAIHHQVLFGGRLGTNLHELGFITEERLTEALARAHGVPSQAIDLREVDPKALEVLPKALAARHKVFPYRLKGKTLSLLMVDPRDHAAIARVSFSLGLIVRPAVVPEFRMIQLLRDYYDVDERWRYHDTRRPVEASPRAPAPETAAAAIDSAASRDELVEAVVGLCRGVFKRVLFFIVREPWVLGWSGAGEGVPPALAQSLRVPLDQPSVFQGVTRDRTLFMGRLGPEPENQRFLRAIDKRPATTCALLPIAVKGRVVNLVYGDAGPASNVRPGIGELLVQLQKVPRAYLRIIRRRVAEARESERAGAGAAAKTATQEDESE